MTTLVGVSDSGSDGNGKGPLNVTAEKIGRADDERPGSLKIDAYFIPQFVLAQYLGATVPPSTVSELPILGHLHRALYAHYLTTS